MRSRSAVFLLLGLAACQPDPQETNAFDAKSRQRPARPAMSEAQLRSQTERALRRAALRNESPAGLSDDDLTTIGGELFDGDDRRRAAAILARLDAPAPGPMAATWQARPYNDSVSAYAATGRTRGWASAVPVPNARPVSPDERSGRAIHGFDSWQRRVQGHIAEIIDRAGWRARRMKNDPGSQTPNRVTVHHTAGHQHLERSAAVRQMYDYQALHMYRPDGSQPPWSDIGYHFVIDGSGRVFEGRPDNVLGAHAGGAGNHNNTGVALMGDFNRHGLTQAQADSLASLITYLALRYDQDPTAPNFILGHKHYRNGGAGDCPGRYVSDYLAELRQRVVAAFTQHHRGTADPESTAFRALQRIS